jgi:large subunit ribosomal protein L5
MSRIKVLYENTIKGSLLDKFGYKNVMMVPKLKKIIISMGVAEALKDKNAMQDSFKELTLISGQRPIITKAKKAISNFKLREDQGIGLKVTLRGKRMYDFFDRFTNIVCPRIRDFRGFNKKGDGRGSYSLGLDDQQVFPELNLDEVKRAQGMNITFVTSANTDDECYELLKQMGMPYKR